ncbi:MAG: PhzF family phenazine biosynthesis protein [Candidatus Obscuribacter sp.]|nr:PhzF family phenazine biosynthesis protein [Candidatus Obscuribacter sp.]
MQIYLVDAFTETRFEGNPAGVVLDADHLSETEMQQLAMELNASETAFVKAGTNGNFDVQFYTPTTEIDFCGHATVGLFHTLVKTGKLKLANGTGQFTEHTKGGSFPIRVDEENGRILITMTQQEYKMTNLPFDAEQIINAIGLKLSDLDKDFPPMLAKTANKHLMLGLKPGALKNIDSNRHQLGKLLHLCKVATVHVFSKDGEKAFSARNFAPHIGIPEDPATGSAAGAFGAYLHRVGQSHNGVTEITISQGNEMGRPSRLFVKVHVDDGMFEKVEVSGTAVIAFQLQTTS